MRSEKIIALDGNHTMLAALLLLAHYMQTVPQTEHVLLALEFSNEKKVYFRV